MERVSLNDRAQNRFILPRFLYKASILESRKAGRNAQSCIGVRRYGCITYNDSGIFIANQ